MNHRIVLFFCCFFFLSLISHGQNNGAYQELLARANLAHLQKNYRLAIPHYEEALTYQPPDALTAYKMAGVYALDENWTKSATFLEAAFEKGWLESSWLAIDPYFNAFRLQEPNRWKKLLQKAIKKEQQYAKTLKKPTLRSQINQMVILDQQLRYKQVQASTATDRRELQRAIQQADSTNLQVIKKIIADNGWPTFSDIGQDGNNNLWLLVQHADTDILFQKHCLQLMEKLKPTGQINLSNYAYLYDRVQCNLNYKQYYGTQPIWGNKGTAIGFRAIIQENEVNQRRTTVGLPSMQIYALTMGFEYKEVLAQQARQNDSLDLVYCKSLIDSAKAAYRKKNFTKTDEYYLKASMVLSGMTDQENYEAALIFADIAGITKEQKYKSVALDFLNLLYLRDYLSLALLWNESAFKVISEEPRWQDIISRIGK